MSSGPLTVTCERSGETRRRCRAKNAGWIIGCRMKSPREMGRFQPAADDLALLLLGARAVHLSGGGDADVSVGSHIRQVTFLGGWFGFFRQGFFAVGWGGG